jgi:hypothetical protein
MGKAGLIWTADVECRLTGSPDFLPPRNKRNWAGLYLFLDVSARPPLAETFNVVARRLAHGYDVFRPTHRYCLAWGVVVFGIKPSQTRRWLEVEEQFTQMWLRHPKLLKQFHQGDQIFAMWFVDGRKRPFAGYIQSKYKGDVVHWDGTSDIRATQSYQERLRYDPVNWRLSLRAISPEMLKYALSSKPRGRAALPRALR